MKTPKSPLPAFMTYSLNYPTLVEFLAWLFCAFASRNLVKDWVEFPPLQWSRTSFFLWLTPVLIYWLYPKATEERQANTVFLCAGIILSLLGILGELNILKNVGFIIATGGMIKWSWPQLFWLMTAFLWLPASSYLLRSLPFNFVILLRLCLTSIGALVSIWALFHDKTLSWNNDENK